MITEFQETTSRKMFKIKCFKIKNKDKTTMNGKINRVLKVCNRKTYYLLSKVNDRQNTRSYVVKLPKITSDVSITSPRKRKRKRKKHEEHTCDQVRIKIGQSQYPSWKTNTYTYTTTTP